MSEPQALSSGSWSPSTQCEEVMGQEGGAPDRVGMGKEGGQVRPTLAHGAKVGRAQKCAWGESYLCSDRYDVRRDLSWAEPPKGPLL